MTKPKYAIVITADERYLPGYNGQINAVKYYGFDDKVEIHLVHTIPDKTGYIAEVCDKFPNVVAVSIEDLRKEYGKKYDDMPGSKRTKSIMKFWRWWYPIERLSDYDAVCVMDADRQIVNDMTPFFDVCAKSDMILLAKNDYSDAEHFSYDDARAMRAEPPIYSNPYFITGKRLLDIFPLIPVYAMNPKKYHPEYGGETTGDMHPVNLTLLHTGMIADVLPLTATQWVFVQHTHVRLHERKIAKRLYLGMHSYGDLLYTYHRRWWGQRTCERFMNGHSLQGLENGIHNARLLWQFTKFFNTQLWHQIDWVYGEFPDVNWNNVNRRAMQYFKSKGVDWMVKVIGAYAKSQGADWLDKVKQQAGL